MPNLEMHKRLEVLFTPEEPEIIHLDLNGILCAINPDSPDTVTFHSSLIGTSSLTLKEELAFYRDSNTTDSRHYCTACLQAFADKLS